MTVHTTGTAFDDSTPGVRRGIWLALLVAACGLLTAPPSFAAKGDSGGEESTSKEIPGGPLSDQLKRYWSTERDLPVIKSRKYRRKGRFGAGLFVGLMSSESFYWYVPVGLRLDYYFTDHWGVELEGMFMGSGLRQDTDLTNFLEKDRKGSFNKNLDTLDQFKWRVHALAVWHPLYGKLAALQRKLAHFDFNVAAGLGAVALQRPNETRQKMVDTVEPELAFGGGFQFFATDRLTLRLTGRGYVYPGPKNYRNPKTGELTVTKARSGSGFGGTSPEKANFFQRLTFATEFLLGATYLF
ncbi:MAG: outer membrane beta-barrel domain-containing protein [Bradymonadaceae bacterium]